jgi:3-methylcrotonyl-CoA carboxylase alpha subunit
VITLEIMFIYLKEIVLSSSFNSFQGSIQRRHQKVIEEAPAPGITPEMREKMGNSAIAAARAVGYVGAGTVEFIYENETFYFMEMNTRLQVEHPITEMITRQDLVEWQIQVASGNKLPLEQKDLKIHGHSFEGRIYSEDPNNNFLPVTGQLKYLNPPKEIENQVRVESGVRQGDEVSIYYDPMIAKLVVWGKNRDDALRKFKKNLEEYHLVGLANNIEFLKNVINHPEFQRGNVETNFIPKNHHDLFLPQTVSSTVYLFAACGMIIDQFFLHKERNSQDSSSPWKSLSGFRVNDVLKRDIVFKNSDSKVSLQVSILSQNELKVKLNDEIFSIKLKYSFGNNEIIAFINDVKHISTGKRVIFN